MAVLKSLLTFVGLLPGVPQTLPHGLVGEDGPLLPDEIWPIPSVPGSQIAFVTTSTTVQATLSVNAPVPTNLTVIAEAWHSFERAFPAAAPRLAPTTIVMSGAAGTGLGTITPATVGPFSRAGIGAGLPATPMAYGPFIDAWTPSRPGSVVGISLIGNWAAGVAAGLLTVQLQKNGASVGGALLTIAAGNTAAITFAPGTFPANPGNEMKLLISTDAGFLPPAGDVLAWFETEAS